VISFEDAAQARKDLLKEAKENLEGLLMEVVKDYHATWHVARRDLENKQQYLDYVKLEGIVILVYAFQFMILGHITKQSSKKYC